MNPMTNVKNIIKLSEQDLKLGGKSSWHDQYKGSAWIFIGGLPYGLTEGDIICVFSQYGEIVHINLVRDKDSGKQKGFCFICYEDQRSTILAVDNLNGIKILGRTLRVDHVSEYKVPKESKKNPVDEEIRVLRDEGCAPSVVAQIQTRTDGNFKQEPQDGYTDVGGVRLPPRLPLKNAHVKTETSKKEVKKEKSKEKPKKSKKERKKKKRRSSSSSSDGSSSSSSSDSSDSSEPQRKHKKKKKK